MRTHGPVTAPGVVAVAEHEPHRVALVEPGRPDLTFAGLLDRADRLAHALDAWESPRGGVVTSILPNRREYYEIRLATGRTGRYFTPISHHLRPPEIAYLLADSGTRLCFVDASTRDVVDEALRLPEGPVGVRVVEVGPEYEVELAAQPSGPPQDLTAGDFMGYTSGTTGRPKGVRKPLSGRPPGPSAGFTEFMARLGMTPGEPGTYLVAGPLYHAAPGTISHFALELGHTVVLAERPSAEDVLALIEEHGVTHLFTVPTVMGRWLRLPEASRRRDLSSLRSVIHSGAPCPPDVKRGVIDWLGPVIHEFYGATEGSVTTVTSEQWLERPGTVGRPVPGTDVVVRREGGTAAPPGEVGQIWYRPLIPVEYLGDPVKTAAAFQDGWVTTGDLGHLDDDGWLFMADRRTDLILTGGVNVYPAEVEAALLGHPDVADAAVIGAPDEDWGQRVVALLRLEDGVDPTGVTDRVSARLRDVLAGPKRPRELHIVDDLPRSTAGKLRRAEVRAEYDARFIAGTATSARPEDNA